MSAEIQQLRQQVADIPNLKKTIERHAKLLDRHATPVISAKDLKRTVKHQGQQYRDASPFPNIVLDNFVDGGILQRVASEVAAMDRSAWHRTASAHERKLSTEDESTFGPFTRRMFSALTPARSSRFSKISRGSTGSSPTRTCGAAGSMKSSGVDCLGSTPISISTSA